MTTPLRTALDQLFLLPLRVLPQHALSRGVHFLTRREGWIGRTLIALFLRSYRVALAEAQQPDPRQYASFNAFFTRALRNDARRWPSSPRQPGSPVDGAVSAHGPIEQDQVFQAKGHSYSLTTLLGGDAQHATTFQQGHFLTLYLSPRDYHRIHMPMAGTLTQVIHVPGRLYPVNRPAVRSLPGVFARNERVVCLFESEQGPFAMILVGALFVGSIELKGWGEVTPPAGRSVQTLDLQGSTLEQRSYARGEELGRFNMGSTVILVTGNQGPRARKSLRTDQPVRLGEELFEWIFD